jgi:hypothetical protein
MSSRHLVKTQSCYVALYDQSSPVNRLSFMASELDAGKQAARRAGQEDFYGLFHFNEYLTNCAAEGQMLAWTLLFDGIFSFEVRVDPLVRGASAATRRTSEPLPPTTALRCPSGRLIVSCLSQLGEPTPAAIEVEPGEYQATLIRNEEAESDHALLESIADYVDRGGPDWSIRLQKIES